MIIKNKLTTLVLLVFCSLTSMAQVGIGTSTPNANSALELSSSSQGVFFPRMTSAQRDAIASPAKGLTIFNTDLNCIQTNIGTSSVANWKCLASVSPSSNGSAIISAYSCSTASAGTMSVGTSTTGQGVTQTITATVTTGGSYSISVTANGVTFAATGTFTGTGAQTIVLTATGTPTVVGSNSFALNTTPTCSFSRTTNPAPLPANITLSAIGPYFISSVYDQDYLPFTTPTEAASQATAQAANGVNETTVLNFQGSLSTTGVTIKIPYTVVTAAVTLPAFSQTINVPASYTEDGIARDVTFSYGAGASTSLAIGSGTIDATLKAVGGTLNAKKLDLQTGIGNEFLGWLLAQFTYSTNSSGGTANFQLRNIAPIPDRNIANANHVMFYVPVSGVDGKRWLNNNLGAVYSNMYTNTNTINTSFNPAAQATSSTDQNAYGSLFQWGRYSDGHELMTWTNSTTGTAVNATTTVTSNSTTPGNTFIYGSSNWYTGTNPSLDNLWQGVSGINNPCPIGFRLPSQTEMNNQVLSWSNSNVTGAFASPLKFTMTGFRHSANGSMYNVTTEGRYWSSTVSNTYAISMGFTSNPGGTGTANRAEGISIRCIYAGNPSTNGTALVSGYDCNTASAGTMTTSTAVSGVTQTITATVTQVGTYAITATANGVTFAASGTFTSTGAQTIVITATGTPTVVGTNSFTLNTTPGCSFSRTVNLGPLPANITLSAIGPYFISSVYDQDYLPFTTPTEAASQATAQAANGVNETTVLNFQGSLSTTGVTIKIPYTVVTAAVTLPAFSQTINVPASYTEDGIARDVTFSYGAGASTSLAIGSGTIDATLQAVGGTLNVKKLDLQTGIGNEFLGWLLAQFTYSTNSSGGTANFQLRNIAPIPDRNVANANHVMFYVPVSGLDGKRWLNNNLGAVYSNMYTNTNTINTSFNPAAQATSSTDQNAYGSLFQFGRYSDGHELINWTSSTTGAAVNAPTTATSNSMTPGNTFIYGSDNWYTGTNPSLNNVWQVATGINNPCPIGFRLPTQTELNNQMTSWSINSQIGAYASPLKLTKAGFVHRTLGTFNGSTGLIGQYWSSTYTSTYPMALYFSNSNNANIGTAFPADGYAIRCIYAGNPSTNGTALVSGYDCNSASAGTMTTGTAVSGVTQTITATVTQVGTYAITATANGVTFSASGTFTSTGSQTIVLTATGTPTYGTTDAFTLNTNPSCFFNRTSVGNASSNGTSVISYTTCSLASSGTLNAGSTVSGVTQTITANVTTLGTYYISTTANGVTFSASGTFSAPTGSKNIILTASGTPISIGSNTFTLNTTPNCNFSRTTVVNPSSNGTAEVSTYSCSTASTGVMTAGTAVSGVTQTITANVTTAGTYNISTTANGVTFAGTGTFASTGSQNIVLTATGTPTYGTTDAFTLNTTPNCSFNRTTSGNLSSNGTADVSSYSCSTASAGSLIVGTAVSGVTQTITATVTQVGTYNIMAQANGVTFAAAGTFTSTGTQTIVLTATGTPNPPGGSNSFILNTTPGCSFNRTSNLPPLPANITLSAISPYFIASVYDQDYLPYTAPTVVASLATAQAANGTNESTTLNVQGNLTTTGITLKIPYTVVTATVSLPAFSQTINVPASFTEDGISRDVTFSYGAASLAVGSGTISATLFAVGGTLNVKKLDIQTGIGNDNLGYLLAQFSYATNNSGGSANFQFRNIAAIPDRNIADAAHVMFYMPVLGADGKTWLNNNLGADYANTNKSSFNPAQQASAFNDFKAYGSLFQWGRKADSHELINWTSATTGVANGITSTNSDIPANTLFITENVYPFDWRVNQDDNLWNGTTSENNPCPYGYRLPTNAELTNLVSAASITNYYIAASSTLKFSTPGYRDNANGSIFNTGDIGDYWSCSVNGNNASFRYFFGGETGTVNNKRAFGLAVRCIKD